MESDPQLRVLRLRSELTDGWSHRPGTRSAVWIQTQPDTIGTQCFVCTSSLLGGRHLPVREVAEQKTGLKLFEVNGRPETGA